MEKELISSYQEKQQDIKKRLSDFKQVKEKDYLYECMFCLLTPQSNAKKCWSAIEQIKKLDKINKSSIVSILKSNTRFHNNKTRYVLELIKNWSKVKQQLNNSDRVILRNWLSEEVNGMGMKEAGHFLRNIGKSENKIAILDRHILRNLKSLEVIQEDKIKNNKHYLEIEKQFLDFSKEMQIPIDDLDLLFWSKETGEIFK